MTIKVDIRLAVQACMAAEGTSLGESLEDLIQSAGESRLKRRSHTPVDQLVRLQESRGDPLLPFELSSFDFSLACFLTSRASFTERAWSRSQENDRERRYAKVYSNWSLVDCGYARLSRKECIYIPDARHNAREEVKPEFGLRPACRTAYRQAVERFTSKKPSVDVVNDESLRFVFDNFDASENQGLSCRCWILGPSGGPEMLYGSRLFSIEGNRLALEFTRPEAILQLSAAASMGHWLHVQGSKLDVLFSVPDITEDSQSCELWSRSYIPGQGYLEGKVSGDIEMPLGMAKECVRRYWWMTLSDKELMLEAISAGFD